MVDITARQVAPRPVLRFLTACFGLVVAAAVAGCVAAAPPDGDPSIRGAITSITPAGDGGAILVESAGKPLFDYDKASVRIDRKTTLLRQTVSGPYETIVFEDLAEGQRVDVWFEGAVAESYPVQARAGTLVVLP